MAQETTRRPTTPGVSSQPPSRPARRRAVVSPRRRSSVVGRNIRRGRAQLALTLEAASKPSEAQAIYNELAKSPVADIAKNAKQLLFGFEAMEQLGVKGSGSWQARRRTDPKHVSFIDRVRLVRTSPNPRVWLGRRRRSVRAALFWVAGSILCAVPRSTLVSRTARRPKTRNGGFPLGRAARRGGGAQGSAEARDYAGLMQMNFAEAYREAGVKGCVVVVVVVARRTAQGVGGGAGEYESPPRPRDDRGD